MADTPPKQSVLIVDDSMVNRKLLEGILRHDGYELIQAQDGEEALEKAFQLLPDLVLLDIMMPKKDGFEVCRELKAHHKTYPIPIIFLSALTETDSKVKGLDLGGADYITKPFDKAEVLARVRSQIKIRTLTKNLIEANLALQEKQGRLDEDLRAAAFIQQSLLPVRGEEPENLEADWRFLPCESVGGDLFSLFRLDERHWGFYVFDVSGHGVPAAMLTVSLSQTLQPRSGLLLKKAVTPPPYYEIVPPVDVLSALDQAYPFDRFEKHFTIAYLVLNVEDGTLRYSSAAHPPPILLHPDGEIELLEEGGTVIGLGGLVPFEEGSKVLSPGDRLLVYTDGIVEHRAAGGDLYGKDRLYATLRRLKDRSISQLVEGVLESIWVFGQNSPPLDDISLLGVEFKGPLNA